MRIPILAMVLKFSRGVVCALAVVAFSLPAVVPATAATSQTSHSTKARQAGKKSTHAKTKKKTARAKTKTTRKSAHSTQKATSHHHLTARQRRLAAARKRRLARARSRYHHRKLTRRELARSRKLHKAFVASTQLRPMAQQLATLRSPEAYKAVADYAHSHTGEAQAAAFLALGYAHLLDHDYDLAVADFKLVANKGGTLDDYAAYLTIQAYLQNNKLTSAEPVLSSFIKRYPDSIFVAQIPVLEANTFIQDGDPQAALSILRAHRASSIANKADYQYAEAKAHLLAGDSAEASRLFTHVYLTFPLSNEAEQSRKQLIASGAITGLSATQRSRRADALYAAHRYSEAEDEYNSLASEKSLSASERNRMAVAAAACQWKRNKLTQREAERLPDTNDEAGARRLYLLMELARDRSDTDTQQSIVNDLKSRFPTSPWLAEALYSSGNMYLLRKDYPTAIKYYSELATLFPHECDSHHRHACSDYSPYVHWRAAWLTYRLGNYTEAAKMFDDQIKDYPTSPQAASALYWRARLYADREHNPTMAAKYYRTVDRVYPHYYYANLAEKRLAEMGLKPDNDPTGSDELDGLESQDIPELSDDVPDQDPHLIKARLLANAGLNSYISPEIQAADGSNHWGSLAEAQIYASYGESWRAMRLMKRALPYYVSAPISSLPLAYWRILYPQPYWSTIKKCAARDGLDPYMVASLIRQESEFNPSVISYANAYGLMQMLPSVGRAMAREAGIRNFRTRDLLDPETNIRLGCLYLKKMLAKFGDHPEYAFAAYNAGDNRVTDWQGDSLPYHDMDEFVESIPFTQTRNYVQAILRNETIYRELDQASTQQVADSSTMRSSQVAPKTERQ